MCGGEERRTRTGKASHPIAWGSQHSCIGERGEEDEEEELARVRREKGFASPQSNDS
jgi:hypothetical protein